VSDGAEGSSWLVSLVDMAFKAGNAVQAALLPPVFSSA